MAPLTVPLASRTWWLLPLLAAALFAAVFLPVAGTASAQSPTTCETLAGRTPTVVPVTQVPIEVTSTTADYFVLYRTLTSGDGVNFNAPISITRGKAGTTTLPDNLNPLKASQYRVEKYRVASPGDVDGDCIDDITELDSLGDYNPLNPGKKIDIADGSVSLESRAKFEKLSLKGYSLDEDKQDIEHINFWISNPRSTRPSAHFYNTPKWQKHFDFADQVLKITNGSELLKGTRGTIVYHPNVPAPDGTLGVYCWEVTIWENPGLQEIRVIHQLIASSMPFISDNLYYYPALKDNLAYYKANKSAFDDTRVRVLLESDILPEVEYVPLNQAEGFGRLRVMEEGERPGPFDIAIFKSLPNDLPRVAGTITTVPQTPLAHINLRAIQNGLPNAFIRDALTDPGIKPLIGKYVYFAVTAKAYLIREATKKEVDDHHAKLRPATTQTLTSDLTVTTITPLKDISFAD